MELESQQRFGQVTKKFLEEGGKLYRVILCEVHRRWIMVDGFGQVLEPSNVTVFAENTLD
jgi:hypothetical protein